MLIPIDMVIKFRMDHVISLDSLTNWCNTIEIINRTGAIYA